MGESIPTRLGPCVVDNAVLSNFVHAGASDLLALVTGEPLRLGPTVLDPDEATRALDAGVRLASELLRPVERITQGAANTSHLSMPHLETFVQARGGLWLPVELTAEELALAERLRSPELVAEAKNRCGLRGRLRLDAGEAEAAAIAIRRGWALLTDDRAAIEVLACLHPEIQTHRSCALAGRAAQMGLVSCREAARLFNEVMVDELRSHATRRRGTERLYLRCSPPRCSWEPNN